LDHFKPYNDVYGYRQGDDVIMMTSRTLAMYCDPEQDFLGHIGGDDFLILFQSSDWERRCKSILETFSNAIEDHLKPEDWAANGYMALNRVGNQLFHPIPSLSLGLVKVEPDTFASHAQLAAAATEAKKQAKMLKGNSLFIERRTFASIR
jgi:diguanylate cyclase (GGDEF)-like protein